MKIRALSFYIILAAVMAFTSIGVLSGRSVGEKSLSKRNELLTYLRNLRPMVLNFPCEPHPTCIETATAAKETPARIKEYNEIKRIYQEGLVYRVEGNYINSYLRFLAAQKRVEALLEALSQSYIDRTESMLRSAIEQKDPNKATDLTLVDVSIEFGPNSKMRRDFAWNRQAPGETRRYDPRLVHYARNKYRIEKNMEKGYHHLGLAKKARMKALMVDRSLAPHQKILPRHRKQRIENYLATIILCRLAKYNAEFIFNLKYPHDQYKLDELPMDVAKGFDLKAVPTLAGIKMEWIKNPYYLPKKLNPLFNLRIPATYRRDALDARNMIYTDEVNMNLKFKFYKKPPAKILQDNSGGAKKQPAKTTP